MGIILFEVLCKRCNIFSVRYVLLANSIRDKAPPLSDRAQRGRKEKQETGAAVPLKPSTFLYISRCSSLSYFGMIIILGCSHCWMFLCIFINGQNESHLSVVSISQLLLLMRPFSLSRRPNCTFTGINIFLRHVRGFLQGGSVLQLPILNPDALPLKN